ncbi:MAG TPA: hypothetical protein VHD33_00095 [Legionellaceae bacterium]|nr:hypothetical protein [Legionellaceae bacterium]
MQYTKVFSQRFNRELAAMDLPDDLNEKIKAIAKVFSVTRHMANAMIFGHMLPPKDQIDRIAEVLDVCPHWLSGRIDKRKAYSDREMLVESDS